MLCTICHRGMLRRTPLYQEILYMLQTAPNVHRYEKDIILTFRLGYFADGASVPTVIPLEDEQQDCLVVDYFGGKQAVDAMSDGLDVIVIPAAQVSRSGVCTAVPDT